MSHAGFEVRPVRRYEAPRYPTTCLEPEPVEAPPDDRVRVRDVLRFLVCALLMLGLVLGAVACGDRARLAVVPPRADGGLTPDGGPLPDGGLPPPDGGDGDGGDIIMGDIAECTPGDVFCADPQTLMTCEDGYTYQAQDCDAYCQATYGAQSYTLGCDSGAYDPCNCYDMLDGGIAQCTPDTVECWDSSTIATCDPASGSLVSTDCTSWCHEHFGTTSTATGCDATHLDNPCGCT
jgi:hypothetical protein